MASEVSRAERALHRRAGLACEAASDAGVPGRFRVWEEAGVLAVLAADPALSFLSVVSGVTGATLPAAIGLAGGPAWEGVRPAVVVPPEVDAAATRRFPMAGFARAGERLLAIRRLGGPATAEPDAGVVEAGPDGDFAEILLAGYEAGGVVAAFLRAEHRIPGMRRFLVVRDGTPVAAAAMTIHADVAVIGGASTLRAYRGQGAQPLLLRHRLRVAAAAGCSLAVATARPGSASAANLSRAGFRAHRRSVWTKS